MPTVPNAPGVPPLTGVFKAISIIALVADVVGFLFGKGPQWGIFLNGKPALLADSVVDFSYKREYTLSDYPVEQGAFESYDKVQTPFDARFRFSAGGSTSNRQNFLNALDMIEASLALYDVVTPEKVYKSVSVVHIDYKRTNSNGVGLIVADVWCSQVRVTSVPAFTNTQSPAGASPVNGGTVQTSPPNQSALSSIVSGVM